MTKPTQDAYTVHDEDDDPRTLTGEPTDAPDDAVEGGLFEDEPEDAL